MCGINGVWSRAGKAVDPEQVARLRDTMRHRGPDGEGLWRRPQRGDVVLGHRRLAIVDLSEAGLQPMANEDGTVQVTFNGEIYNHAELRVELERRGHTFRSRCDAEVLVHLYEEHGEAMVHRLVGMFAFAIWDERDDSMLLARDRLGIKPLYYTWNGATLAFASEVKPLVAAGFVSPAVDAEALVELLTFQNILSDRSLFRDVRLLPSASVLTLANGNPSVSTYWEPTPQPAPVSDEAELLHAVRDAFDDAVERQLVSDVEVASYLSGGLDSSSVTSSAARHLARLTTFTTGFDVTAAEGMEAGFDERPQAAALARALGTHHHELCLDEHDLEMVLPRVVLHLEEPRMNFSYPNYLTAGFASRWVKVVLSSVGGDEIFGGYPWRYALAAEDNFVERYFGFWTRLLTAEELREGLAAPLADADLERPRRLFDDVLARVEHLPNLDRVLYFELRTYLHGLLVVEDKLSMAHSLESRVPFLDNELVDLTLTIPGHVKLDTTLSKDLFRKAMRERLPREVVERGKMGFIPPQAAWFRGGQSEYLERILLSDRAREHGVLRPEFVQRLIAEHRKGIRDRRLVLWTLLCLEWWHRVFVDREHAT